MYGLIFKDSKNLAHLLIVLFFPNTVNIRFIKIKIRRNCISNKISSTA